jgi:hypothetical protein
MIDARAIAEGIQPGDLFELTDPFEHTFEVCDSLAEAVRHAPEYGCELIHVLRNTGKRSGGMPLMEVVYPLSLTTAREVVRFVRGRR